MKKKHLFILILSVVAIVVIGDYAVKYSIAQQSAQEQIPDEDLLRYVYEYNLPIKDTTTAGLDGEIRIHPKARKLFSYDKKTNRWEYMYAYERSAPLLLDSVLALDSTSEVDSVYVWEPKEEGVWIFPGSKLLLNCDTVSHMDYFLDTEDGKVVIDSMHHFWHNTTLTHTIVPLELTPIENEIEAGGMEPAFLIGDSAQKFWDKHHPKKTWEDEDGEFLFKDVVVDDGKSLKKRDWIDAATWSGEVEPFFPKQIRIEISPCACDSLETLERVKQRKGI